MRTPTKAILTVTLWVILMTAGSVCFATPPRNSPYEISFEPQGELVKGAPITMHVEFTMLHQERFKYLVKETESISVIFVNPRNYYDTLSRTTFSVPIDSTYSVSETFQIVLPDVDTSLCILALTCGHIRQTVGRFFVAIGDKIEFFHHFNMPPKLSRGKNTHPIRDTLTHEQLQQTCDVILDLGKASARETAEKLLGTIPDSCLYDSHHQYYRMTITLEMLIKLADQKVGMEYATPPPWGTEKERQGRTKHRNIAYPDSNDLQGAIPEEVLRQSPPGISLDHVDGLSSRVS
ncbi:MAG: hypothetical protein GY841_19050 [FCB group bacterium]|nr:hypothetical protein [FCB group bacterium]